MTAYDFLCKLEILLHKGPFKGLYYRIMCNDTETVLEIDSDSSVGGVSCIRVKLPEYDDEPKQEDRAYYFPENAEITEKGRYYTIKDVDGNDHVFTADQIMHLHLDMPDIIKETEIVEDK